MASLLRKTESCKCSQHGVLEYRALVQKQPRHMPLPRDRSPGLTVPFSAAVPQRHVLGVVLLGTSTWHVQYPLDRLLTCISHAGPRMSTLGLHCRLQLRTASSWNPRLAQMMRPWEISASRHVVGQRAHRHRLAWLAVRQA